jgi:peptidoglycan/LPS O-acetylase OafA/YrhL
MSSEQLHAWGMSVITACAGVLVYLAALDQGHVFEIPVLKQVFEYIGSRSFGLYLIQGFTLRAVILTDFAIREQFSGVLAWAPAFTAFRVVYLAGLTFVLVECNYQFLEKPMIRRGRAIVARRSLRLQASHSAVASAITKS